MLIHVGDRCENKGKYGNLGISSLQISLTPKLCKKKPQSHHIPYILIFLQKTIHLISWNGGSINLTTALNSEILCSHVQRCPNGGSGFCHSSNSAISSQIHNASP